MKSKFIFSIFILSIFLVGLSGGFYFGMVGATGSHSSQLYSGAQEMRVALVNIKNNDIERAKATLCRSIKIRLEILEFSAPVLHKRKEMEVSELQQAFLFRDIEQNKEELVAICT